MAGVRDMFTLSSLPRHQQFVFSLKEFLLFCHSYKGILRKCLQKYAPCFLCKAFLLSFYIYFSSLVHNRVPSDPLAPLELKDPPACRVCPEKEEVLAFPDPKGTE